MWQAPTYRKILIQNDWSYYVCPFRYLKKSQLSKHLWFSNTWTKNILEDSKGSFSKKKKTLSLLPCVNYSSFNRETFRRWSKDTTFLFRKVSNISKIFMACPFMQTEKQSFSSSWSCLPNISWSPRTVGYRVSASLLYSEHPVVYTLSTEQRREKHI